MRTRNSLCWMVGVAAFWMMTGTGMAQSEKPVLAYQLTHVDNGEPFPSPDGKKILFESKTAGFYQLFTMNPDGSEVTQITHDPWNHDTPAWSPDGSRIAFVSDQNKHSVVFIMNVNGTELARLSPENAESIHPTWSPDSTKVIYCADDDLAPLKRTTLPSTLSTCIRKRLKR